MTERNFRDAYNVLQQHAETLREQAEPNIDDLLTIVTESVAAYQVCRERIDAVEAALKVALDGAGVGVAAASAAAAEGTKTAAAAAPAARRSARAAPPPPDPEALDDDIPF
ncbi:MAG: exodeoxyribonuclease VII small subunit [Burkholderiaceae bacterium]